MLQSQVISGIQKFLEYNYYVSKNNYIPIQGVEENIFVHRAKTEEDFEKVFNMRWEGYKRYFRSKYGVIDQFDVSPNVTLLLAEDEHYNPVGTVRILDRRYGKIELDDYIDVDFILSESEKPCIEATRFSVLKTPNAKLIKKLLWKGILMYCHLNEIDTIVKSIIPATARLYKCLPFEHVGFLGIYNHPLLKNLEHHTYKLSISKKQGLLKLKNNQLYNFFFKTHHPNIRMDITF